MAKLHNYHVLCPLIDQKSFLGVARDREDEHVIITLGRNVVNKHRLTDQKQISGWTSKDHITAPVIYDSIQNSYVGVFNNNTIKMWMDESVNLDKLKKYKFPINILKVIQRANEPPLVIFTNGNCASLPYAIENRKTYESKSLLKDSDIIVDMESYKIKKTDFICYILKTAQGYDILTCPIRDELGDLERAKLTRVQINRHKDVTVVGEMIFVSESKAVVYVLWSDAKMYGYNLYNKTWKKVGTVPWISTATSVSIAWMGQNHMIIFGSNENQDGAIIIAYNYILGVGSCKYPMKMYREKAKLYCFDEHIILEASNHIGMLPFSLELNRNLSSLLASHEIQNECTLIADWGTPTEPLFKSTPELEETVKLGITERSACIQLVPSLVEKRDIQALLKVLQDYKDIPESVLAILVKFAITTHAPEGDKVESELLNEIFRVLFCDALLIPDLRSNLSVNDSVNLLKYILYLIFVSDLPLEADYESRLFDWCCVILDAFYQQYVISKDPNVQSILENLYESSDSLVKQLFKLNEEMVELHNLIFRKSAAESEDLLSYSIEEMQI